MMVQSLISLRRTVFYRERGVPLAGGLGACRAASPPAPCFPSHGVCHSSCCCRCISCHSRSAATRLPRLAGGHAALLIPSWRRPSPCPPCSCWHIRRAALLCGGVPCGAALPGGTGHHLQRDCVLVRTGFQRNSYSRAAAFWFPAGRAALLGGRAGGAQRPGGPCCPLLLRLVPPAGQHQAAQPPSKSHLAISVLQAGGVPGRCRPVLLVPGGTGEPRTPSQQPHSLRCRACCLAAQPCGDGARQQGAGKRGGVHRCGRVWFASLRLGRSPPGARVPAGHAVPSAPLPLFSGFYPPQFLTITMWTFFGGLARATNK